MAGILPTFNSSRESSRTKMESNGTKNSQNGNKAVNHPLNTETNDSNLLPFLKEDVFTDTILVVEGHKIYTHRSLLGYASPYFTKLLNQAHSAAVAEKKSKAELKIENKNYADFVDLFTFFHPGVCRDLNERMALRLLPLADEYQMSALKDRCEKLLVHNLKTSSLSKPSKGSQFLKNGKSSTPDMLLKYTKAADHGNSKVLCDQCIRMFWNPDIPLKDLKLNKDISDSIKSRIFELRMDTASTQLSRIAGELDKEKHEKEMLKKQISDRAYIQKRAMAMSSEEAEPYVQERVVSRLAPGAKTSHKHQHNYLSHQRQIKYSENILGPVHEFSRDDGM